MQLSIIQNPIQLIGPAVLITIVGFFIHFFGKVIADQKPYTDNRNWEIELSGVFFFINFILIPGSIGYALANRTGNIGAGHLIHFILVIFCGTWLLIAGIIRAKRIYGIKVPWVRTVATYSGDEKDFEQIKNAFILVDKHLPLWVFSIIFAYVLVLEYQSNNLGWFITIGTSVFANLILLALNYSLRQTKLPKVDVCLIGDGQALAGLTLLKINEDSIRLRDKDKIIILNKNQVQRLEIQIAQDGEKVI